MVRRRSATGEGGDPPLNPGDDGYAVGYGRPPRYSQFKPGQSGNPRGRPKRLKSVGQMLREAVSRPITITENGRKRTMTWLEAMFAQTARAALQGDGKAMDRMIRLLPAIQAAIAEASGGPGSSGYPAGGGAPPEGAAGALGGSSDRALLAFFADQIARGELSFAEMAAPTSDQGPATDDEGAER